MRLTKTPLAGLIAIAIGTTSLVLLPSASEAAVIPVSDVKLYFHSANGGYLQDALMDPAAWIGDAAPAGATLTKVAPTGAEDAEATSLDPFGVVGTPISPTWLLPSRGSYESICIDVWARSNLGATPVGLGALTTQLYVQNGNHVIANVDETFVSLSTLSTPYTDGIVHVQGLVKNSSPAGPYNLIPGTTISFLDADLPFDYVLVYDSVEHPSSITLNPTTCAGPASASPSASPEPEPSEEPEEPEPTCAPAEEPAPSPSATPGGRDPITGVEAIDAILYTVLDILVPPEDPPSASPTPAEEEPGEDELPPCPEPSESESPSPSAEPSCPTGEDEEPSEEEPSASASPSPSEGGGETIPNPFPEPIGPAVQPLFDLINSLIPPMSDDAPPDPSVVDQLNEALQPLRDAGVPIPVIPGGTTASPSASPSASEEPGEEEPSGEPSTDPCATPAPVPTTFDETNISYSGATAGRYFDTVTFKAKVTSGSGTPIATGQVEFLLGNAVYRANVGADGVASVAGKLVDNPGSYILTSRYVQGPGFASSERETPFRLNATSTTCALTREATPNASKLTATLTRGDGSGVAGVNVVFGVNNSPQKNAITGSDGVARYTSPTKGASGDLFQVTFNGDARHVSCSASTRV